MADNGENFAKVIETMAEKIRKVEGKIEAEATSRISLGKKGSEPSAFFEEGGPTGSLFDGEEKMLDSLRSSDPKKIFPRGSSHRGRVKLASIQKAILGDECGGEAFGGSTQLVGDKMLGRNKK